MSNRIACLTAGAVLVLGVAACGGDDNSSNTSNGSDLSGEKATFVTFGGFQGRVQGESFAAPVAKATGLDVSYAEPTDYAKLQTQVQTGNVSWTVVQGDAWWANGNCDLLEHVPASVDMSHLDQRLVIDNCSVPGDVFTFNVAYDASAFPNNPPKDWSDFFDTTKYPGKRAIMGSYPAIGQLEGALLADGVKPSQLYPLDLDRAFAKLDTIRVDLIFFDTVAQAEQMMIDHEPAMIVLPGNTTGYEAAKNGADWKPIWNQSLLSWDAYFVPKGANLPAATAILDQVVSEEGQTNLISQAPLGPTIKGLEPPEQDQLLAEWSPASPDHVNQTVLFDQEYYAKNFDTVNTQYIDWVGGG
jgi:putative spermidine/putrescine transport system substrate-binding protein